MRRLTARALIAAALIGVGFGLAVVILPDGSEPSSAETLPRSGETTQPDPTRQEPAPQPADTSDESGEQSASAGDGTTEVETDGTGSEPDTSESPQEPSSGGSDTESPSSSEPEPDPEPEPAPEPWQPGERFYAADSPWNTVIPEDAFVLPQSAAWIGALSDRVKAININQSAWTPGVFSADPGTARQTVFLANGWVIEDVPIPDRLQPSADTDAHAIVIDETRGLEYDFFRLERRSDGSVHAVTGVPIRLAGSGWWQVTGPWAARASGAALGGGLIRAEEVEMGEIPHALACAAPKDLIQAMEHGVALPATTSDGRGSAGSMPMGSRLQLDPSVDVASLDLEPGQELIARALQLYGMYVVDSTLSELMACYAENETFLSNDESPYPESWRRGFPEQLIELMRVVAPPSTVNHDSSASLGQPRP